MTLTAGSAASAAEVAVTESPYFTHPTCYEGGTVQGFDTQDYAWDVTGPPEATVYTAIPNEGVTLIGQTVWTFNIAQVTGERCAEPGVQVTPVPPVLTPPTCDAPGSVSLVDGDDYVWETTNESGSSIWYYTAIPDVSVYDTIVGQATWSYDLAQLTGAACAGPSFDDVPIGHPFYTHIAWLAEQGITTGYADGTFHPSANVERQAMAAFLYRFAGSPEFVPPATPSFTDVPADAPFFLEIEWLASTGITTGWPDGTFRPSANVERQAMAAFLYRFAGSPDSVPPAAATFTDVPTNGTFFRAVEWLASTAITTGWPDHTFRPSANVERQAMAAFLMRFDALGTT